MGANFAFRSPQRRGQQVLQDGAVTTNCRRMRNASAHDPGADHRDGFNLHHCGPALSRSAIAALIAPTAVRKLSARRLRSSVVMGGMEMQMRRNVVVMSST